MNIFQLVCETDLAMKQTFAAMEAKPWGYLFSNRGNPLHYDANHAHIHIAPAPDQNESIVREVVRFYSEKEIFPRFYLYGQQEYQQLLDVLVHHQFRLEFFQTPVQVWTGAFAEVKPMSDIRIEPVTTENYEDCLLVESIDEFGGRAVREKAFALEFRNPAYRHYLLRWKGEPASTACLFRAGDCVRVESVATVAGYRGRGLIGHLLRYVQEKFARMGAAHLLVCPINEQVEKVYQRYGFDTVGHLPFVHAFRGGKGIHEIR
jgi:GNAT superfamily N-acetyltransferase